MKEIKEGQLHFVTGRGIIISCNISGITLGDVVTLDGKKYVVRSIEASRLNGYVSDMGGLVVRAL